jgi:hypothetical protein
MLFLDFLEIGFLCRARAGSNTDALPRDDDPAKIFEEADELRVARGRGDRSMKRKVQWPVSACSPYRSSRAGCRHGVQRLPPVICIHCSGSV